MSIPDKISVQDEAADVCRDVVARIFMPEGAYQHDKIPAMNSSIVDTTIQRITANSKVPRKYIAHCVIMQRNGAGLHSVSACSWNAASDGCYVYKAENKAMICILTVYGVTM
eukprot:GILI01029243.1.p1 GENE.GILI01029243.1~~GILI01029243.1.p1  ORF type:complete len:112 (-),score=14.10 GILI01029243.1:37-372(-)